MGSERLARANQLFSRMREIYGVAWDRRHGKAPSPIWREVVGNLSDEAIRLTINTFINSGEDRPPGLPIFKSVAMQNMPRETAYKEPMRPEVERSINRAFLDLVREFGPLSREQVDAMMEEKRRLLRIHAEMIRDDIAPDGFMGDVYDSLNHVMEAAQ